ncbi:MAG TPA: nucleotidyltransferase family protein [Candidatus Binatia bacterium]|jgi:molybdenum cofactor cytidylyltransferase
MVVAVVLSAGESSRMGRPKALLPVGDSFFLERIVNALRRTRVEKIFVVLGHNARALEEKIRQLPVTILVNPDYSRGQLSSLQVALRELDNDAIDGIVLHLVDHPFIDAALVDRMIEAFYASQPLIVVPVCRGRRGHPVIFSRGLFPELLASPLDEGAKSVVRAHAKETVEVETDDEGITYDIDTPEEYRRRIGGN